MHVVDLRIPEYLRRGIKPNERGGRMDTYVYGGDTETLNGEPMSMQFYSKMAGVDKLIFCSPKNATEKFFAFLGTLRRQAQHVIYVHNLDFDAPEFLWSVKEKLVEVSGGQYDFTYGAWSVRGVYGHPTFVHASNQSRKISVLLVDSHAWAQTSLAEAAKLFCPSLPKLKAPNKGVWGLTRYTSKDMDFCAYAMRDAEVAYYIGLAVQKMHREFNIRQAVSLADMSAKIFRHHFLDYTIPQPTRDTIMAALKSYHGGKNNVLAGAAPYWHKNVTALDISSAFPYAMYTLPAFSDEKLYRRIGKKNGHVREVEPYGVYCVSGSVAECDYPVLFSHGFEPLQGKVSDVWVFGLELNEALRSREFKMRSMRGWFYQHERDTQSPALRAFVKHFYALKQSEKDPILRYMYKIILNALYGKFIQTRKNQTLIYTDVDANETIEANEVVAGGMFHPFIASAITSHTRAYMHRVEHAHNALQTATDGIYTYLREPKRIPGYPRTGLGSLTVEARGDLALLRNKCNVLYSDKPKKLDGKSAIKSQYFSGKYVHKYAKHGFMGGLPQLEKCVAHGTRKYKASRPNRLREATKRGLRVNEFVERDYVLKVAPLGVYKK